MVSIASGFGDPHIYTLDGELYTYNPIGEFWMIESTDFTMQARTVRALSTSGELTQATQFQAFVMKALLPNVSATVQVEINNNRTGKRQDKQDTHPRPVVVCYESFIQTEVSYYKSITASKLLCNMMYFCYHLEPFYSKPAIE